MLAGSAARPRRAAAARLEARIGPGPGRRRRRDRVERVVVPMGGAARRIVTGAVPAFGAAAGYAIRRPASRSPPSLRAAPRVAAAAPSPDGPASTPCGRRGDAPHPPAARLRPGGPAAPRRRRAGDVLRRLLRPARVDVWAPYLRVDATPGEVSRTMTAVLAAAAIGRCAGGWWWTRRPGRRVAERLAHGEHPADDDGDREDEPLHGVATRCGPSDSSGTSTGSGYGGGLGRARRRQLDVHRHGRSRQLRGEARDVERAGPP